MSYWHCEEHESYQPKCKNCHVSVRKQFQTKEYKESELQRIDDYIDSIVKYRNELVEEIDKM